MRRLFKRKSQRTDTIIFPSHKEKTLVLNLRQFARRHVEDADVNGKKVILSDETKVLLFGFSLDAKLGEN